MPERSEGFSHQDESLKKTLVQNSFDPTMEGQFDFSALQKTVVHDASIRSSDQPAVSMLELSGEQQERLRELAQQTEQPVQEVPGGLLMSDEVRSALKKIEIKRQKEIRTEVKEISLEQKRKIVNELWKGADWPGLPKNEMKQGSGGNCYAISALEAIKRNPDAFDTLLSRLEKVSDTVWRVSIHNADTGMVEPVDVDLKELEQDTKNSMRLGSLGDRVIERAMQSFVSRKRDRRDGDENAIGRCFVLNC